MWGFLILQTLDFVIIGMIIEPSIPLPSDLPAENALGIIIILIPAILILAMVLPNGSNTKEEEE